MDKYKKWVGSVFSVTIILIILLFSLNYIIDPYNYFGGHFDPKNKITPQRRGKTEKLDAILKENKYNSFIMGGSRIGPLRVKDIEKYSDNEKKYYNLFLQQMSIYDAKLLINYLVKNTKIKKIDYFIGVDSMFYNKQNHLALNLHHNISGENRILELVKYLSNTEYKSFISKISMVKKFYASNFIDQEVYLDGSDNKEKVYKDIMKNQGEYIKNEKSFHKTPDKWITGKNIEINIKYLKEMEKICNDNKIEFRLIVVPHHYRFFYATVENDYREFLKEIIKIKPVWDFNSEMTETFDNKNFYETSHFFYNFNYLMLEEIYEKNKESIYYVDSKNINEHLGRIHLKMEKIEKVLGVK